MRAELNKITFINYEIETVEELIVLPSNASGSNRVHTLLYQSRRIQRASGLAHHNDSAHRPEMSKFTFMNVFDNHKPEDIEKLDRLYFDFKGHLPSRRQLSAVAQSIGIQQSKIKKWFMKRKFEIEGKMVNYDDNDNDEPDQFWNELNSKLNQIDREIQIIEENLQK